MFCEHLHMDTPVLADQQRLTWINCMDIGCSLEDLPRAMAYRDGRWERESQGNPFNSMAWWCEFNSHWVPHTSGLMQKLSKA